MGRYSLTLAAQPSWLSGFARSLDVAGTFDSYNESPDGATADERACRADIRAVAEDFSDALHSFKQ